MTKFNWDALTGHSETAANIQQSPPTDSSPTHPHHSKLSHVIETIRHTLAHEHEKLPEANDAEQQRRTTGTSISPALQAVASSKLNENNMGEDSHQNDETWGWPGLGSFSSHSTTTSHGSKSRTESTASEAPMEKKVSSATFEAIDNAAESEAYGWPGLGDWPVFSRK